MPMSILEIIATAVSIYLALCAIAGAAIMYYLRR